MRILSIAFLLLFVGCGGPHADCVKLGMTFEETVKRCGKPDRLEYRNGTLSRSIYYSDLRNILSIGFTRLNTVNYFKWDTPDLQKVEYSEDVE